MYSHQFPPPPKFSGPLFSWAERLLDSQITSGNKQTLRPRHGSRARGFHDTIGSAVDVLEGVEVVLESVRNAPENVRDAVRAQVFF